MAEKSKFEWSRLWRILTYAKPYRGYVALSMFAIIGKASVGPARPMVVGMMVNNFVVDSFDINELTKWTWVLVAMVLVETLFQLIDAISSNYIGQSIVVDLRKELFSHLMKFKLKYFDKTPVGQVVTRLVSDIEAISEVFSQGILTITGDVLSLVVVIGLMFYTNWSLAAIMLIAIPLMILATKVFTLAMRNALKDERNAVAKINTFVQEHLTGLPIIKVFVKENREYNKFVKINKEHRNAFLKQVWATSIYFSVVDFLTGLSVALLLFYAVWSINADVVYGVGITGEVISYIMWAYMLFRPIRTLADRFNVLQRGVVRSERVLDLLDDQSYILDEGTVEQVDFKKEIKFEDVHFSYVEGVPVLQGMSLAIDPGEKLAIVGSTGAGKSTIVSLITRLYSVDSGSIKIGDVNIEDIQLGVLRKGVGIVMQDVFLFSDTVLNNITLGNKEISLEDVQRAAKLVGAHDFIMNLKNGYDQELGERANILSTGQRQLLAFIRAFVYNPDVLILDEATSSLDNESEELIQAATEKLTQGRTSIIIAHRLSTIREADRIIVLEKGKVVEQGNHKGLLAQGGRYHELYTKQFSKNKK